MKKSVLFAAGLFTFVSLSAQNLPVSTSSANKNVVLEELTGVNCQYCPDGHLRAQNLKSANPGRVVLVNIHAGSFAPSNPNLKTTNGDALDVFFDPTGYPAGSLQRTPHSSDMSRIATGRGNWAGQASTALAQVSPVNVALDASIDAATRVVTVTVEMYYTSPFTAGTDHYLNVGILQNNWEGPQVGSALNPDAVLPNGNYLHQHMFRGFINNDGTWGDVVDASSTGVITRTFTYTLPTALNAIPLEIGELEFFAIVHNGQNTVTTSQVFTGAETAPTYTNVPGATGSLNSIVNSFNVCEGDQITPIVKVVNTGEEITALAFSSSINGGTPVIYNWTGSIGVFGDAEITLPAMSFVTDGSDNLVVTITSVNGGSGSLGSVTSQTKAIAIASTSPTNAVTVKVTTDQYGSETTWKIFNSGGTVVAQGGPYADLGAAGTTVQPDVNVTLANDCYSVVVYDTYGDGFDGSFGNGDFKIVSGTTTVASVATFTTSNSEDAMRVNGIAGINEEGTISMTVFPNPATDNVSVTFEAKDADYTVSLVDLQGRVISTSTHTSLSGTQTITLPVAEVAAGNYMIKVASATSTSLQNVVIK